MGGFYGYDDDKSVDIPFSQKNAFNIFIKHLPTTTKQSGTSSEWENMTSSRSFLESVLMVKN